MEKEIVDKETQDKKLYLEDGHLGKLIIFRIRTSN